MQGDLLKFRIRAQWWGPDGAQIGVADDTVEATSAVEALEDAVPCQWRDGQYTHATISIEPLADRSPSPSEVQDAG